MRVAIAATASVALVSAASAVARATCGGWTALRTVEDAPRRRLVGVLLILAAPLAALSIGLALQEADAQTVLLPSAVVALAVASVAVRVAPGVIPTLGLFAACELTIAGFGELFDSVSTLAWIIAVVAGAVVWTALAPRLTGARTLALCLGLFTLVYAGFSAAQYDAHPTAVDEFGNTVEIAPPVEWGMRAVAPFGYAALLGVVVTGATGLAAAAFVGTLAAEQFGALAAFFAVGIVLLGASAALLVRRGRRAPG